MSVHERQVLIVGFSPLTRIGIARVAAQVPDAGAVRATAAPEAALRFTARNPTGLVILDELVDPGFELARNLTEGRVTCPVVVLIAGSPDAEQRARTAFAQGASAVALNTASAAYLHQLFANAYSGPGGAVETEHRARPLSNRETEILELIAEGLSSRAMAERLFVSVETVRTHAKNIIRKLDANGRAEAVSIAYRIGILDSDSLQLAGGRRMVPPGA